LKPIFFTEFPQFGDGLFGSGSFLRSRRLQNGHGEAVLGNENPFTPGDPLQQFGKMRFCIIGPNGLPTITYIK